MPTDPDVTILRALVTHRGEFVSGNLLAHELEMSRVGVWARLEKLRTAGFQVAAVRHRGYRLDQEPEGLHEALLQAYLEVNETPVPVRALATVDSTNSEAERELANAREAPFVVVAGQQTRGRGRFGRVWFSPPAGNLYASFAFRPLVPHQRIQTITLGLGVTVCNYLAVNYHVPVTIKWPNDLVIDGKKVAGMLTEARIDADRTRDLVFGIGLNVLGETANWPDGLGAATTTLSAHTRHPLRFNQLTAELIEVCVDAYETYVQGGVDDRLAELWARYDALAGEPVQWTRTGGELAAGVGAGLAPDGALRVKTASGIETLHSAEVSLAKAPPLVPVA